MFRNENNPDELTATRLISRSINFRALNNIIHAGLRKFTDSVVIKLIINQVRRHDNIALGMQMSRMVEKHLGLNMEFLGNVAYDEHVHDAICQQVSFLERYPYTKTASDLREIGKQIVESAGKQLTLRYM